MTDQDLQGQILQNRYQIGSRLGEGGIGVVYQARDTALERDVAVKVLSQQVWGTDWQARMLQEAQAAAKLNHPNIVTVYDVGQYQQAPFIVMELVPGRSLAQARPATTGEVIDLARQLCQALAHAHEAGIVHRDIKPDNVIVTGQGTAKLMDFGIAHSPASKLTREGDVLGTVSYMAPEQAMGEQIDGRADLYSLGVMLYELTTGALPFEADNWLAVITQHLHAPIVPPRAKDETIPAGLDALIMQLLSKKAGDRPASAAEVGQTLVRLAGEAEAPTPAVPEHGPRSMLNRIVRGRMVGRQRELAESRAHWQRVQAGSGQVLFISGEPGIGKTRLVREIVTLAEVSGGIALAGECFAEGSAPYAPLAQMIREGLSHNRQLDLPNLVLADLITIAPDLRARYPQVPANPPLDPAAEQQRLFESMVLFCTALSARAPLLLFVDDVHWADSGTLYLLRYLARRLQEQPVLLVATYREVELHESHPLQDVLQDLSRARLASRLKLIRLEPAETEAMLTALFAEATAPEFRDGIHQETEGNPFFIEEVCKALVESGKLYFEAGVWHRPSMAELEIPPSIRVAVQSRVARLSAGAQKALQWAAIVGREFEFELLLEVSGQAEEALIDALEEAGDAQLIEEVPGGGGERFAFGHALIPAALREGLSGLRRGRLHRQVAVTLETLYPDDYKNLAYHYGEAGDEIRALSYLTQAGHQARRVYANEDAVRYYSEALSLISDDHPEYFDLLTARMRLLDLLGRSEDQLTDINNLLSLAEEQGDKGRQVDALIAKTDHFLARATWGVPPRTWGLAEHAVKLAEDVDDMVRKAHALRRVGSVARYNQEWQRARKALEEAMTLFKDNNYPGEAAACFDTLRFTFGDTRNFQEIQKLSDEALALSQQSGNRWREAIILRSLAPTYLDQKQPDEALSLVQTALELNREIGDIAGEASTLYLLGLILLEMGKQEEAIRYLHRTLEMSESIGFDRLTWDAGLDILNLDFRIRGDYQAGISFLDERIAVAQRAKEKIHKEILLLSFTYNKMEMLEYMGLYKEALLTTNDFAPINEKLELQTLRTHSWVYRLRAALGQHEEALRLLEASLELEPSNHYILFNAAFVAWLGPNPDDWPAGLERAQLAVQILEGLGKQYAIPKAFTRDMAARLCLAMDLPEEALTNVEEAMQLLQTSPEIYGREQFNFTYSRALRASGQLQAADEALKLAYTEVMRIAEQTQNETMRRSWLENVRYNREIIAAAREQGVAT